MPTDTRGDVLWVLPQENHDQIIPTIEAFVGQGGLHEAEFGPHRFRLADTTWDDEEGVFCGTIYRKRRNNLPSELTAEGATPVPIAAQNDLGEPICFAYYPGLSAAVVQYSTTGARYSRLASFLNAIAFRAPFTCRPY
jgi:hypothetical protein